MEQKKPQNYIKKTKKQKTKPHRFSVLVDSTQVCSPIRGLKYTGMIHSSSLFSSSSLFLLAEPDPGSAASSDRWRLCEETKMKRYYLIRWGSDKQLQLIRPEEESEFVAPQMPRRLEESAAPSAPPCAARTQRSDPPAPWDQHNQRSGTSLHKQEVDEPMESFYRLGSNGQVSSPRCCRTLCSSLVRR